ncbi:MAG: SMC-Scp complex subunit ScpB [Patescibacteria group bacterium]|nr:SMC-Scp complex subunit ScpB [Patescibacteria group bacterium]
MTENASTHILARLEALLFVHGEPISRTKVEKVLGIAVEEQDALLEAFQKELESDARGLSLLLTGDQVQLVTKPQYGDLLLSFMKEELSEALTPATVEALSIIAYGGPISRARLDFVRGVNSAFTVRTLRVRGLVERMPDPSLPHSFLYDITADCLRHLGVTRREDLPRFEEFKKLLTTSTTQPETNENATAISS